MNFRAAYLSDINIIDIVNWLILVIGLIGLQGYIYKIKCVDKRFWMIFFPVFVMWSIAYLVWLWLGIAQDNQTQIVAATYALIFILTIPQFIALYRYGLSST